jgi:rhomboid protease GluP
MNDKSLSFIPSSHSSPEQGSGSSLPPAPAQGAVPSFPTAEPQSPASETSGPAEASRGGQARRRQPIAVWVIIAANVLVWLAMTLAGGSTNPYVLLRFGAKVNPLIVQGQIWRLVTPIFLHIGLLHLAFNMYAIYIFGPQIERFFGSLRFTIIYLLSGIYGVLLSFAFSPHLSAGASGAIFGLIGTAAVFFYRYRDAFGRFGRQTFYNLLIVIGYNLVFTFTASNIDIWGHLGGLFSGAVLGWYMMPHYTVTMTETGPRLIDRNHPKKWGMVVLGAVALLALGVWMAIALQAPGVG